METRLIALLRLMVRYFGTDLSLKTNGKNCTIEMNVDGTIRQVKSRPEDYQLIRFLMYLSNMQVTAEFRPQVSIFDMVVDGQPLHLRYAVIKVKDDYRAVLRILNNNPDFVENVTALQMGEC